MLKTFIIWRLVICIRRIHINQYPSLKERDSLKIYGQANMEFTLTSDKAHFIVIEMQQEKSD
jgi:hypothetical protein